jgi:hypothetical protein
VYDVQVTAAYYDFASAVPSAPATLILTPREGSEITNWSLRDGKLHFELVLGSLTSPHRIEYTTNLLGAEIGLATWTSLTNILTEGTNEVPIPADWPQIFYRLVAEPVSPPFQPAGP